MLLERRHDSALLNLSHSYHLQKVIETALTFN